MELFKIHFNKPDNSKLHVCIKADCLQSCQGIVSRGVSRGFPLYYLTMARVSRDVACVQAPPLLSKNQRRGVCDSPLVIVYGGHVIFPGICGK